MARKVKINPYPNPTNLTMPERELAIAVVQSIRDAMAQSRKDVKNMHYWGRREWTAEEEKQALDRVCRAALNQLAGRQKTEKGIFTLDFAGEVQDEDMDYVRRSLGLEVVD